MIFSDGYHVAGITGSRITAIRITYSKMYITLSCQIERSESLWKSTVLLPTEIIRRLRALGV